MTKWLVYDNAGDNRISVGAVCCTCRKPIDTETRYARRWQYFPGLPLCWWYACVECARAKEEGELK